MGLLIFGDKLSLRCELLEQLPLALSVVSKGVKNTARAQVAPFFPARTDA